MRGVLLLLACVGPGYAHATTAASPASAPPAFVTAGGTTVDIRDARPAGDREWVRGPATAVAFQRFDPSPWDAVRGEVERAVAAAAVQPTRVEVGMTAHRALVWEAESPPEPGPAAALPGDSRAGSGSLLTVVTVEFVTAFVGVIIDDAVGTASGPAVGASCFLDADVRVVWPDGRVTDRKLSVRGRCATKPARGWPDAANVSARQAAAEFGAGVRRQIAAGPDG